MTELSTTATPVCVIVGAGPGNGAAFARCFAAAGYRVALLARDLARLSSLAQTLPNALAISCDVTDSASVRLAFATLHRDLGRIDVLIYNAGKGSWGEALAITEEDFESAWRTNAFGAYVVAREVLPAMLAAGSGTLLFVGATASRRGRANTTAFAAGKAAQRSLAESLARTYGPRGIHVSLLIIDGVVDAPTTRAKLADHPDEFFIKPDDIAETAFFLSQQPPSAWTFELDVRPFGEAW
jgi:NAD(P)-dependent dehydrogenase (short-subunit alcohol dehydrogenase family)